MVRTHKAGFLTNKRRTNVMLSRCKIGMVVIANRTFLMENIDAKETLIARLAMELDVEWISSQDIASGERQIFDLEVSIYYAKENNDTK